MGIVLIIFRQIITFALVASFSVFFMHLFVIAGILSTKIQRNIAEPDDMKNLKDYMMSAFGGLIAGLISLFAMAFL